VPNGVVGGYFVAPSVYFVAMAKRPSRAVKVHHAGAVGVKNERHRGAWPTVGGGVRAPHRVTVRLSAAQFTALNEAAKALGYGHRGIAKAARLLLAHGIALNELHHFEPEPVRERLAMKSPKPGRPAVSTSRPVG
jgi:hypothetical protein